MDRTQTKVAQTHLRTAHDKLMQAQQKMDNTDLDGQMLLGQALDAVNAAQMALQDGGQYTYMND